MRQEWRSAAALPAPEADNLSRIMILVIDNYDSFTYNLVHFLGDLGARCAVHRNDQITVDEAMALKPAGIVLSPGPCTPNEAGICMDLVRAAAKAQVPLFGVCLGHQAIGQVFGGKVVRAPLPMHGKLSGIQHKGQSVFEDVPSPFQATRYHSLIVDRAGFPGELEVTAETGDIVMGLRHKSLPIHGVQFHPESIASEHGHALLANFLELAGMSPRRRNVRAVRHAA
jgi:anthranilate synthase/aminodeoxychorismate synthase-like glutamine amidotransferase